jgi:hypothetical protein
VPHAADDAVGELAFVRTSGLSSGLAFRGLALELAACRWMVTLLGDADDVQHAVDSAIADVEPVADGGALLPSPMSRWS